MARVVTEHPAKRVKFDIAEDYHGASAFGDLRVCELDSQAQGIFNSGLPDELYILTTSGGGVTPSIENSMAKVSCVGPGTSILETRRHLHYKAGLGSCARFTARFTQGVANCVQLVGVGDAEDGLFYGFNGTRFGVMRRSSASGAVVDNWTYQEDWNGRDAGAFTAFDPTKLNVYEIQFQYLGAGEIRFQIEENDGTFDLVHDVGYAGTSDVPSLGNPTLPFCLDVQGTQPETVDLYSASYGLFTEGIHHPTPNFRSFSAENTAVTSGNLELVMSIKVRETFNGKTNHLEMEPTFISLAATGGNRPMVFTVGLDSTFDAALTYADLDTTNSIVQTSTTTANRTGGIILGTLTVNKEGQAEIPAAHITPHFRVEPGQTYDIFASTSGNSSTATAAVTWIEDF